MQIKCILEWEENKKRIGCDNGGWVIFSIMFLINAYKNAMFFSATVEMVKGQALVPLNKIQNPNRHPPSSLMTFIRSSSTPAAAGGRCATVTFPFIYLFSIWSYQTPLLFILERTHTFSQFVLNWMPIFMKNWSGVH